MSRFLLAALLLASCGSAATQAPAPEAPAPAAPAPAAQGAATPVTYDYRIVATHPHDRAAFTQGLVFVDGDLYESTGQIGFSTIRRVRIADGRVLRSVGIPPTQFGEGLVNWGDELLSLTWTDQIGHRWNRRTLRRTGQWRYTGEGWGLTQNGTDIIMSDGTSELRFLDPRTMTERRRLSVTFNGEPVNRLNELEWVKGEIFANVWMTPLIVRIDPASGRVTGVIDLTGLATENRAGEDEVLNGIAYDAARDRLYVTGKNWPRLYQIDLVRRPAQ